MKILILFSMILLAVTASADEAKFDPTGKISCKAAHGGYDDKQQVSLGEASEGKRDLTHGWDKDQFVTIPQACGQNEAEIVCSFTRDEGIFNRNTVYQVVVDLTEIHFYDENDPDDYTSQSHFRLKGSIDRNQSGEPHSMSCTQLL